MEVRMRKSIVAVVFAVFLAVPGVDVLAADSQGPKVVVSIQPLHSLVAGIMEGVGEPRLLIKGGGSPHGYALRPSEARLLADAQLVVWVGHRLEGFLEKPLSTLGRKARQLELAEELESVLLPVREGGGWEAHVDGHEHNHDPEEHGEHDQHFWLDPLLAKQVVEKTAAVLAEIDPVHQQQYQKNAARLKERLDNLHARLSTKLNPYKNVPYVVFHDAYQYFEAAYGLNAVGSITIDPERKPGAGRIRELRAKIQTLNARCVFSEPQFESRMVATLIEGSGAKTGILDPLGAKLPAGSQSYFLLMDALADNLVAGLRE
jgi:zinc transport system substrate-binding protein